MPQEAWQELANLFSPRLDPEQETVEVLGNRDLDPDYFWASHIGRYASICDWRDAG